MRAVVTVEVGKAVMVGIRVVLAGSEPLVAGFLSVRVAVEESLR